VFIAANIKLPRDGVRMCVYFVCGGGEPDYTGSPAPGVRLIVLDGYVISFACRPLIQGQPRTCLTQFVQTVEASAAE
jgi:hypothetical protein